MSGMRTALSGLTLPPIGLGAWTLRGRAGSDAIVQAIRAGYTLIDSAVNYENEGAVGHAVRESGVARDEIIVASKLPGRFHATDDAKLTIEESVFRMGLDAIDLYLIHWPNPSQERYVDAWRGLIEARDAGLVRAIGVSNFLPEHLERLHDETGVLPDVNQIELHPYFPQLEQVDYHAEHGILTQGWAPLGRGGAVLREPSILRIAESHGATPGQVVLAWAVSRGVIPIPRSASPERQRLNLEAASLELSADEVAEISALGRPDGRVNDLDPSRHEEF